MGNAGARGVHQMGRDIDLLRNPGDSRLAKAVNRGFYVLLGFGMILVIGTGLALMTDFTGFLGQFHGGMQSISRFLDQSLHWMILGTTVVVILLVFALSLFHDPLLDPLGIEHRQNLGVAGLVVVLCVVVVGIHFARRRSRT